MALWKSILQFYIFFSSWSFCFLYQIVLWHWISFSVSYIYLYQPHFQDKITKSHLEIYLYLQYSKQFFVNVHIFVEALWLNKQFQTCKKLSSLFYRWGGIRIEWTPGGKFRSCCRINQIYHPPAPGHSPLLLFKDTLFGKMQKVSLNIGRTNSILSRPSQNWISGHASASEKGRQLGFNVGFPIFYFALKEG